MKRQCIQKRARRDQTFRIANTSGTHEGSILLILIFPEDPITSPHGDIRN